MPNDLKRTVLVIQRRMTHYRVPLFERLRDELSERDCRLMLAYGQPTAAEERKQDAAEVPWAERLTTRYFLGGRICWQPFSRLISASDLVVMTHENKLIHNLVPQLLMTDVKVALWGHGANLQGNPVSLRERFKRITARYADWWFAYTQLSLPLIVQSGFPEERVTVLNNAVDTTKLSIMTANVSAQELASLRRRLGLTGNRVGVYVGSLYQEKRIDFMLSAVAEVRRRLPDFEFLIIGAGPLGDVVERFCANNPWAKYLGMQKGQEKVNAVALAQVMINPGLVGLGILDAFVCGVPMVTTDCGLHSPEIAYLENGNNGLITANTLEDYVAAVVSVLQDGFAQRRLRQGCLASAAKYTVENMARNFAQGAVSCLDAPFFRTRRH